MVVYGLVSHMDGSDVVEWFASLEQAQRARQDVLHDEPEWVGLIDVAAIDLAELAAYGAWAPSPT